MAGLYGVIFVVWLGYQRVAVKLEHFMDAPCYDDVWMLVEPARGGSPRRCLKSGGQS